MDERRRSIILLEQADWGDETPRIEGLKTWRYYAMTLDTIRDLQVDALYKSPVHGSGHINRVLLLAALIGREEDLEKSLLHAYYMAASYHDVGRYFDGLDLDHGANSAQKLEALTGYEGEALLELQGAVAAHSQPDSKMDEMIALYGPKDVVRTRKLSCLLKDADNLDRVRLGDLKPQFLRHESAKALVDFSKKLFSLDQELKAQLNGK